MSRLMKELIAKKDLQAFKEFIVFIQHQDGKFLLRNDLLLAFEQFCVERAVSPQSRKKSSILKFMQSVQELMIQEEHMLLMHRCSIGRYRYYRLRNDGEGMEEVDVGEYLDAKEHFFSWKKDSSSHLHIDFVPFYDFSPSIRDPKTVGNGIRFLNRYLCSKIFQNPEKWNQKLYEFLKLHHYNGQQLLINGSVFKDFDSFFHGLDQTISWLKTKKPHTPFSAVENRMKRSGFEAGWGHTVERITDTMELFRDLVNEPDDSLFEQFISRVPMPLISRIAIISPHGWFGQEHVLGRPDTGGQVIYILDQVRALERYLKEQIKLTGLDLTPRIVVLTRLIPESNGTSCHQPREKIYETDNCWILRIPFRHADGGIVRDWISRFHIWPFLERFSEDGGPALLTEFGGRPDLIIGNYSDGNLVGTLLSDRFNVIQCSIAHALEKTKYLFSDMDWENQEENYHFSLQFTADMIAMNKSDFIITSTQQEIIGTEHTMGQYESYQTFTLPGLYQVVTGVDLFAPKFNVIPPGVDENIYFPYVETEKRVPQKKEQMEHKLYEEDSPEIFGVLRQPEKPPIFTMARFDRIKNITGLIEAYGISKKLQSRFNLIFAAAEHDPSRSSDAEEREEIMKAHELINKYELRDKIRWLPSIPKLDTGEAYRMIADRGGIFVQPALFEAFGLTILEAMLSGLPTFGPIFGGPSEIITNGVDGFLINTSKPTLIARRLEEFLKAWGSDPDLWQRISRNGIDRVRSHFNWNRYSRRLINLAKLYGFWRYSVSGKGKIKMDRYCDFIYYFLFKKRAEQMEESAL